MVHTCDRCNKEFKKLWMLNRHLQNRKFPCKPNVIAPLISPIQVPDPIPETNPIQIPDSVQVQPTKISSTSDTLFSDQKVEWEYQNVKRKLGKIENLQQECCIPKEFTRQRFYSEIEREGLGKWKGQLSPDGLELFMKLFKVYNNI